MIAVAAACGTTAAEAPSSTPPTQEVATTEAPAASGTATALEPAVAKAAAGADVIKMKIRLDGSGAIVKQSVYHGDKGQIAEPVLALAESKFPGSTPRRYETEWYADLGEVHEVEVDTKDGKKCEVAAKADGTELYVECHETEAALSAAAKKAITDAFPDAKILEVESKKGPGLDEITVELESGGVEYYFIVKPDGSDARKLRRIPAIVEVPVP
ncbi:MAG: hypothetical protein AAF721_08425 [Myxococcota bacterium]